MIILFIIFAKYNRHYNLIPDKIDNEYIFKKNVYSSYNVRI